MLAPLRDRFLPKKETEEEKFNKDVEKTKQKMAIRDKMVMELTKKQQKRQANRSRVLRQMDGDTASHRVNMYRQTIMFHAHAALNKNSFVVNALRNRRQDANARDDGGRTALHFACRAGSDHAIYSLLREEATVDDPDVIMGWTPLHYAVRGGHRNATTLIIQNSPQPKITINRKDKNGMTPLMLACGEGHIRVGEVLIFEGADIDETDVRETIRVFDNILTAIQADGWTALHYAAFRDQPGTTELLVDFGAALTAKTRRTKETPMELAERLNSFRVALLLFDFV